MKVEREIKAHIAFLQQHLLIVRADAQEGRMEEARKALNYVKNEFFGITQTVDKLDGSKIGINLIFRHPYHVPEEIWERISALEKSIKQTESQVK